MSTDSPVLESFFKKCLDVIYDGILRQRLWWFERWSIIGRIANREGVHLLAYTESNLLSRLDSMYY